MYPTIVVVEPTLAGCELITAGRRQSLDVVVLTADGYANEVPEHYREQCAEIHVVDTNDEDRVVEIVDKIATRRPVVGVLPGFEFYVDTVARLARRLGVPGIDVEHVELVRDKHAMRTALAAAGLEVPAFRRAIGEDELRAAAARIGFPCVMKPVSSAGSVHVSRSDDLDGLVRAYRDLLADERLDMGRRVDREVVVEEFLDGPEFSVEGWVRDGRVRVAAVTGKLLAGAPYFVEVGHTVPPRDLTAQARAALERCAGEVVAALHLTDAVFHAEIRVVAGRPVAIELGARLPGDHIVDLVRLATGISLPDHMVAIATGVRAPSDGAPSADCAGIRYAHGPGGEAATVVPDLAAVQARPDVVWAETSAVPGERPEPLTDFRGRLGAALLTGPDPAAIDAAWAEIAPLMRIG